MILYGTEFWYSKLGLSAEWMKSPLIALKSMVFACVGHSTADAQRYK